MDSLRKRGKKRIPRLILLPLISCASLTFVSMMYMYSLTLVHENRISFGDENTSIVSSRSSPTPFRNDFAAIPGYAAREIWIDILKEGQQLMKEQSASSPRLAAVEVGANDSEQAVEIAKNGLESHSIEPSPKAFAKIIEQIKKLPADITDKIFLYNAAAGDSGEGYLNFSNSGSTGASVLTDAQAALIQNKDLVAKVKSITMEQVLNNEVKPDYNSLQHSDLHSVFAAKIDVQGFEPKVFQGMKKAIKNHKIDFILTEWWPKGVNKMNGYSEQCGEALQYLYLMADAGYTLYATHIVGHPRDAGYMEVKRKAFRKGLPFSDIKLHCLELYKLEVKLQLRKEAMGYWTDVLAVAPNAKLPRDPVSNFGRTIKKNMEESKL